MVAGAGIDPKWLAINNIMASFRAISSKLIPDSSTTRANSSRTFTDTFTDSGGLRFLIRPQAFSVRNAGAKIHDSVGILVGRKGTPSFASK